MKKYTFCYSILVMLFFFSCHKEKGKGKEVVTCYNTLIAITKDNSTNYHKIVRIDTSTGMMVEDIYNFPFNAYYGTYHKKENCYYVFNKDDTNNIRLFRYNFKTKKSEMLIYTGQIRLSNQQYNKLFYNDKTNKLYYIYYYGSGNKLYEVLVIGNTCNVKEVFSTPENSFISSPTVDENSGSIYYIFDDGNSNRNIKMFNPDMNKQFVIATIKNTYWLEFNKNDNMLYAITSYSDTGIYKYDLIKINPIDGSQSTIVSRNIPKTTEIESVFDICNNRFVLYKYEYWSPTLSDISWLNVTNGEIIKSVTPGVSYWSLTYISGE